MSANVGVANTSFDGGDRETDEDTVRIYAVLIVIQWVESVFNIALSFYFVHRVARTALIHPNMRVLFTWILVIPYVTVVVTRMCLQVNDWLAPVLSRSVVNGTCVVIRLVKVTNQMPCALTIPCLAAERLWATFHRRNYEWHSTSFATVVSCVTYIVSLAFSVFTLYFDMRDFDLWTDHRSCEIDDLRPKIFVSLWVLAASSCYVGIIVFLVVYRWNIALNARERWSEGALRTRFQYRQQVATAVALAPGVVPYALLVSTGVILGLHTATHHNLDQSSRGLTPQVRLNFQIMYMIVDVYAIGFKVLFLLQYPALRRQVRRDMNRLFCQASAANESAPTPPRIESDVKVVGELYFKQLDDRWRTCPQPHR